MSNEKILVVDDEEDIIELVNYNLSKEGYKVLSANSGEVGLDLAKTSDPDLIVLDIMLPGMNGLDVCRTLKSSESTATTPIIMLSAKGEEADIVTGLELGADDYLTKPFSPRILLARVRAVLRRPESRVQPSDSMLNIHELAINPRKHEVHLAGEALTLTATEFRILQYLAVKPGWVFTRHQIVEGVHGDDYPVTDRSIDVQVAGLRKKLGKFEDYIETVRGVGYRFKE